MFSILCIHERRSFDWPSDMRVHTLTSAPSYLNPIKFSSICLRSLSSSASKMVFLPASQLFFLLIPICSFSVVSTARSTTGILVIGSGGNPNLTADRSVEFWSPANPQEGSCELSDYPREMKNGPTVNLVSDRLVACYYDSCEIYNNRQWDHLTETRSSRWRHSSAVKENRILLIGGGDSRSTEWISVDGSPSQAGPFEVRHGSLHCTIQLSSDLIVVTGGVEGVGAVESHVTEYQLTGNGNENPLTPMHHNRRGHACGVYQGAAGQQVMRVLQLYLNSFNLDHDDGLYLGPLMNVHKCTRHAITQMLRCFSSPGGLTLPLLISPALRLACHVARTCIGEIGKQKNSFVCALKNIISYSCHQNY